MKFIAGWWLAWLVVGTAVAGGPPAFGEAECEGRYPGHLQGICTDGRAAIYWSWTTQLVKTDARGRVLQSVPVANHHGDLCHHDGRVYVAVNLGQFNQPAGKADSWVFVYDGDTLGELARHPVPEVVHGAGGIAWHDGTFIVVGGLPGGVPENYLYEYDAAFRFRRRHVLATGHTDLGIQTATYARGAWWFGTYGEPRYLLCADEDFRFTGKWVSDAALGIVPVDGDRFLIGTNRKDDQGRYHGKVSVLRFDPARGLVP